MYTYIDIVDLAGAGGGWQWRTLQLLNHWETNSEKKKTIKLIFFDTTFVYINHFMEALRCTGKRFELFFHLYYLSRPLPIKIRIIWSNLKVFLSGCCKGVSDIFERNQVLKLLLATYAVYFRCIYELGCAAILSVAPSHI